MAKKAKRSKKRSGLRGLSKVRVRKAKGSMMDGECRRTKAGVKYCLTSKGVRFKKG